MLTIYRSSYYLFSSNSSEKTHAVSATPTHVMKMKSLDEASEVMALFALFQPLPPDRASGARNEEVPNPRNYRARDGPRKSKICGDAMLK